MENSGEHIFQKTTGGTVAASLTSQLQVPVACCGTPLALLQNMVILKHMERLANQLLRHCGGLGGALSDERFLSGNGQSYS